MRPAGGHLERRNGAVHAAAPSGVSRCIVCGRLIMRNRGWWWLRGN
jgi:hypothetical protein